MGAVDVISADALLWSFYLLAVKDPRRQFVRLVKREVTAIEHDEKDQATPASTQSQMKTPDNRNVALDPPLIITYDAVTYPETLQRRLPWVGTLLISMRLSDWRIGDAPHDRRQPSRPTTRSRLGFVAFAVLRSLFGYLVLDTTATLIRRDPYFVDMSLGLFSPLLRAAGTPPDRLPPLLRACCRALLTAAQIWAAISQLYYLPLVLPVCLHGLGLVPTAWAPHLLPSFFGSPVALLDRGLRGFWSIYWHQTMRFVVAGPGELLIRKLRGVLLLSPAVAELLYTICAFAMSGFVHTGLVPRAPLYATISTAQLRWLMAGFFLVQPVGLLAEKLMATWLHALVPKSAPAALRALALKRALNAAWILVWSCLCFPMIAEALRQLGVFRQYPVPWSLMDRLGGGSGWMWDFS